MGAATFSVINNSLPDSMLLHGKDSPAQLWAYLKQEFGTLGLAHIYGLFSRAMRKRITGKYDIAIDMVELSSLFSQLKDAKVKIPKMGLRVYSVVVFSRAP